MQGIVIVNTEQLHDRSISAPCVSASVSSVAVLSRHSMDLLFLI